jgi:fused signal recognition particle receptor
MSDMEYREMTTARAMAERRAEHEERTAEARRAAEARATENARVRAERLAALEAERNAKTAAAAEAKRAATVAMLEARFIGAGGTPEEFALARDGLVQRHLEAETLRGDDVLRRRYAAASPF